MLLYFDNWTVLLAFATAISSLSFLGTMLALIIWKWAEKFERKRLARRIMQSDEMQLFMHNLATEEMETQHAQLDIPTRPTNLDSPLS